MNTRMGKGRAVMIVLGAVVLLLAGPAMAVETGGETALGEAKEELTFNMNVL